MKNKKELKTEVFSHEEIYEPTGKFLESGEEVIFTKKTTMKINDMEVVVRSNVPSPQAIKNTKRKIREIMNKHYRESIQKNNNES
ncbi:hypothetical protein [Priestia aryabhattai]|uniref:Uncharacterized protein n=1 Tax=Priestia aryabhattai TaxID=412384 RepID=A0ABD7WU61_PRIAR|nr:hypothetical protein [Priestia aryabhattai]WEA43803.1 hypothetical protein PWO00_23710 [Priestia aryabhattai]